MSLPVMLITGTSRGLGRNLAEYYSNNGYFVIGCSRSEHTFYSSNYQHYQIDLAQPSAASHLFKQIKEDNYKIGCLINNAGISNSSYLLMLSEKSMNEIFQTNVISLIALTKEAIKQMKNTKSGRIINISSIHVPLATEGTSLYSSSKAAVEQFSRVIAKEISSYGITINTVGLSFVNNTGMIDQVSDSIKEKIQSSLAIKENVDLADVINILDFFISPKSRLITGQTMYTSGF